MNAVLELEEAYNHYKDDLEFNRELTDLLNNYAGRPSRLYYAAHMTCLLYTSIMTVKGVPLARNNCLSFFQNQKRR